MRTMLKAALFAVVSTPTVLLAQESGSNGYSEPTQVELGIFTAPTTRAVSVLTGPIVRGSASFQGAELSIHGAGDGGGFMARYAVGNLPGAGSSLAGGRLEYADGLVFMGGRSFGLGLGYALRTFEFNGRERRFGMPEAGFQTGYFFPGAGIALGVNGTYARMITAEKSDSLLSDAITGATSVTYAPPRFPIFARLEYRRELFNLKQNQTNVYVRREEVSAVSFMIGLQYGLSLR